MTSYSLRAVSYDSAIFEHCGPLLVHAVFPHTWHLRSATRQIVSVVTSRWNGPLSARVATLPRVSPGTPATLCETGFHVGEMVISFEGARPWNAHPDRPQTLDLTVLRRDLEGMHHQVLAAARGGLAAAMEDVWPDRDGFGGHATGSPTRGDATSGWLARGRAEISSLRVALCCQDGIELRRHAVGLLGLGPGLTPSGDDVLCGLIAGLSVLGRRSNRHKNRCEEAQTALTDCMVTQAPRRTTSLSSTFLQCAARGVVTEPLLQVLETAGSGTRMNHIDDVLMLGHSSGSDMLTGALLAGATLVRWEELFGPAVVGSR
jgi:hypothetical protein